MFAARFGIRSTPVSAAALATFGSGLLNLVSAAGRGTPPKNAMLRSIFPLEFVQLSSVFTLVLGIALIVASINVYRRKRRALEIVAGLAAVSIAFHLAKGNGYEEAVCSVLLLSVLVASRRQFDVRSGAPDWRGAAAVLACAIAALAAYGETRAVFDHSSRANAFGEPLQISVAAAALYTTVSAFRPAAYRLRTLPQQRAAALRLTREHGRAALDFFKVWPDK